MKFIIMFFGCWIYQKGRLQSAMTDSNRGQASPKTWYCGGQATVEYAIVAGIMVALVAIMSLFLTTFGDYGERVLQMIASDYP